MTVVDVALGGEPDQAGAREWAIRPMRLADVEGVMAVIAAADEHAEQGSRPPSTPPTATQVEARRRGHARFVQRDGPGAWVAASGDRVVGVAEAIRRGDLWGLAMLFVDPDFQSRGVGRRLLDAALGYAAGARVRMIQASEDPRALRRYAMAGLAMHPAAELGGVPDRGAIPADLAGRPGSVDDLELVAAVEAHLGLSRSEDVAFELESGLTRLEVVDGPSGCGWAVWKPGRVVMLGATDESTAATLLWRALANMEGEVGIYGLTAAQNWAFTVAHAARLTVRVTHAMFIDGMALPGPWIPSGWYF
jgi:GNAT superfamily N-acetyltransferase